MPEDLPTYPLMSSAGPPALTAATDLLVVFDVSTRRPKKATSAAINTFADTL